MPLVVEYDRRKETAPRRWRIDPDPTLMIGRSEGPEEYLLVNPLAATQLSDGAVVVRDSSRGYFSLRYYDASGAHLATASRFGAGPFEFRAALGMHRLPGDSILVVDSDGRHAVFGPRGERVREGRFDLGGLVPLQPLSSRLVDATHIALGKPLAMGLPDPGVTRNEVAVVIWDASESTARPVVTVLSSPVVLASIPGANGVAGYPFPFAPETSVAAGAGKVWVGRADRPEIHGYDVGGRLVTVIRFTDPPENVDRAAQRMFRAMLVEAAPDGSQARYATYARSAGFPDAFPHYGRLEVDRLGRLWVKRYELPWSSDDQAWDVFTPSGQWTATVSFPPELVPPCERAPSRVTPCDRILEVGSDYVLLDVGDARDVRRVGRFNIERAR